MMVSTARRIIREMQTKADSKEQREALVIADNAIRKTRPAKVWANKDPMKRRYRCRDCNIQVNLYDNYCSNCGQALAWGSVKQSLNKQ